MRLVFIGIGILIGYLSGSIIFANIAARLFKKEDMLSGSSDKNPGTANAFMYGGFSCGIFTLAGDILKSFLPVYLFCSLAPSYLSESAYYDYILAAVTAAPVIGHAFPVFYGFRGGKGIAATFGCLLGLLPDALPLCIFASVFIFLSVCVRITPHFYRTIATYILTAALMFVFKTQPAAGMAFLLISAVVILKMYLSKEEKERPKVRLLWMH